MAEAVGVARSLIRVPVVESPSCHLAESRSQLCADVADAASVGIVRCLDLLTDVGSVGHEL